jgi:hypothetical protein
MKRTVWWLSLSVLVLLLTACGGGGTGTASTASPTSTGADASHGALILDLSGGASRDVDHVWVTVGSVAFHAQADRAWSSSDSTWVVIPLSTPVVVDLATLATSSHSDMTRLLNGVQVPAGTYAQMRLFPLAHDAPLSSAGSLNGLQYNDQVDYTDNSNVSHSVPLEFAQIDMGWRLTGSFVFQPYVTNHYVVQADVMQSLVRFTMSDAVDHFTFKPSLINYDTANSGAIFGFLDATYLCGSGTTYTEPNCAKDVIVTAQRLSDDGLRYESVRRFKVGSTGGFTLYPLPSNTQFDVVITGRHMRPMIVKGVTVTPSDASNLVSWTTLGALGAPLDLQNAINPNTTRSVNVSPAVSPRAGRLHWGRTADVGGQPYEVAAMVFDPFAGSLAHAADLPQGNLRVATYSASVTTPTFQDVQPVEGADAFSVTTFGTTYDNPSAVAVLTPTLSTSSVVSVNNPTRSGTLGTGTLTVQLQGSLSYDTAQIVVADVNGVVDTQTVSGSSASFTLPAGSQAAAMGGGAIYAVAIRASSASGALKWVRAGNLVDLRSATAATVMLTLP